MGPGSHVTLAVFLGNPGNRYHYTRHNAGFLLAEHLPFASELSWQKKFNGEYADHVVGGRKIFFLKPLTYMNKCGESIAAADQPVEFQLLGSDPVNRGDRPMKDKIGPPVFMGRLDVYDKLEFQENIKWKS